MREPRRLTALIQHYDESFVALCPELDVASEGDTADEAFANLKEAVDIVLEYADNSEIVRRLGASFEVRPLEVAIG